MIRQIMLKERKVENWMSLGKNNNKRNDKN